MRGKVREKSRKTAWENTDMKLNLHILKTDLEDIVTDMTLHGDKLERTLIYPVRYAQERRPLGEYLYLVEAEELPEDMDFQNAPSFLCIGEPPAIYRKKKCGILIVDGKTSMDKLLNRVLGLFYQYNKWETDIKTAIASNQPLQLLGELTEPFFNNPVGLYDHAFHCFFIVTNQERYKNPYEDLKIDGFSYLPGEDIEFLKYDKEYINSVKYKKPTIFPADLYGYRSLYMNIFSEEGICVARIVIDEISHTFTEREFALIAVFADFITLALRSNGLFDFRQNPYTTEVIEKMLSHIYVEEEKIMAVLRRENWKCSDNYFCFVVYPSEFDRSIQLSPYLSVKLSAACPAAKYIIFKEKIVFIANLTQLGRGRDEVFRLFIGILRDEMLKASISTVFSDFKNLYYYYRQCMIATRLEETKFSTRWYCKFEDCFLDYVMECSLKKMIPQALYPEGLLRLIEYDREKGTDYTMILKVYLENNMSPTAALKKLYMHRNTFAYRLRKLMEILDMDLENPDVRLVLQLTLKILYEGIS